MNKEKKSTHFHSFMVYFIQLIRRSLFIYTHIQYSYDISNIVSWTIDWFVQCQHQQCNTATHQDTAATILIQSMNTYSKSSRKPICCLFEVDCKLLLLPDFKYLFMIDWLISHQFSYYFFRVPFARVM